MIISDTDRATRVSDLICSHAPSEFAKEIWLKQFRAHAKEVGLNSVILYTVGIYYDGLAYGNWPWTRRP